MTTSRRTISPIHFDHLEKLITSWERIVPLGPPKKSSFCEPTIDDEYVEKYWKSPFLQLIHSVKEFYQKIANENGGKQGYLSNQNVYDLMQLCFPFSLEILLPLFSAYDPFIQLCFKELARCPSSLRESILLTLSIEHFEEMVSSGQNASLILASIGIMLELKLKSKDSLKINEFYLKALKSHTFIYEFIHWMEELNPHLIHFTNDRLRFFPHDESAVKKISLQETEALCSFGFLFANKRFSIVHLLPALLRIDKTTLITSLQRAILCQAEIEILLSKELPKFQIENLLIRCLETPNNAAQIIHESSEVKESKLSPFYELQYAQSKKPPFSISLRALEAFIQFCDEDKETPEDEIKEHKFFGQKVTKRPIIISQEDNEIMQKKIKPFYQTLKAAHSENYYLSIEETFRWIQLMDFMSFSIYSCIIEGDKRVLVALESCLNGKGNKAFFTYPIFNQMIAHPNDAIVIAQANQILKNIFPFANESHPSLLTLYNMRENREDCIWLMKLYDELYLCFLYFTDMTKMLPPHYTFPYSLSEQEREGTAILLLLLKKHNLSILELLSIPQSPNVSTVTPKEYKIAQDGLREIESNSFEKLHRFLLASLRPIQKLSEESSSFEFRIKLISLLKNYQKIQKAHEVKAFADKMKKVGTPSTFKFPKSLTNFCLIPKDSKENKSKSEIVFGPTPPPGLKLRKMT